MTEPRRSARSTPALAGSDQPPADAKPRILIVDDEPMITSILSRLIGKEHVVHVSHSSSEVRNRVRAGERFDAVLCDLMMPEMSGMDLYSELKQIAPGQAERMIFMTGGAFTDATRKFLEQVPNPRVDKPFDLSTVRAAIGQVLRQGSKGS